MQVLLGYCADVNLNGSLLCPDPAQRLAKIIVDNFSVRAWRSTFCLRFGAILVFATRFYSRHYFWHQRARCLGFNKQTLVKKYGGLAGVVTGEALRNFIDASAFLEESFDLL